LNKYLKKLLPQYQKMGFNLTPNNFEEPIPDLRELDSFDWGKESSLPGIDLQVPKQIKLFNRLTNAYLAEFKELPDQSPSNSREEEYFHFNPAFRGVDAAIYYGLIRDLKPRRIIEIGAGFSTFLAAHAALRNKAEKRACDLTAIEPYASETLCKGVPGVTRLLKTTLQKVPLAEFEKLGKNDILFIDSSHVLKIGSDVQLEFLEILPRLKKGVWVHFHDIFLPFEYPEKLIRRDFKFYNEQYFLQAFLAFNPAFEVLWAGQYMFRKHWTLLGKHHQKYFQGCLEIDRCWRSVSFWIRRK
jgi:hypothetical protein